MNTKIRCFEIRLYTGTLIGRVAALDSDQALEAFDYHWNDERNCVCALLVSDAPDEQELVEFAKFLAYDTRA